MSIEVVVKETPAQVAETVAGIILQKLNQAVQERGKAAMVLAGGNTFAFIYQLLAKQPEALDWSRVTLFFGDERRVAAHHPESNYGKVFTHWLAVFEQRENRPAVYSMVDKSALEYQQLLYRYGNAELPFFDLVLLGVGADGHTASLYPARKDLLASQDLVVETEAYTVPFIPRLTLTPKVLGSTRALLVVAVGEEKKAIIQAILKDETGAYPISQVIAQAPTELFLDKTAAGS